MSKKARASVAINQEAVDELMASAKDLVTADTAIKFGVESLAAANATFEQAFDKFGKHLYNKKLNL